MEERMTKLKVILDIEVESDTECGPRCKGNQKNRPGTPDEFPDFCLFFDRQLLRNYGHKLMRLPACQEGAKK